MDFRIESTRGDLVESMHRLSVAVVDHTGRLIASAGDPTLVSFWRSAAKPFQALPVVQDGAADHWKFTPDELALACASHSSETIHLDVVDHMLRKIGCTEQDMACGPHPPLGSDLTEAIPRVPTAMTPRWSNCSGKHAAMLGLARHRGWSTAGYEREDHPVQIRCLDEVARWAGLPRETIRLAVDGCTAVCFGLPLQAMATAYARLGANDEAPARRIREAMMQHPMLVAGTGRLCTDLMAAFPGQVLAKVGADGIYSAAWPSAGIGIALKVEDGDMRSARPALLAVLRQLAEQGRISLQGDDWPAAVARHAELPTLNTRGGVTGVLRAAGKLRYAA
ncbi:MAG: asparaginase [Gemmatimonadales bacterium]